jgi:hypothetical protein
LVGTAPQGTKALYSFPQLVERALCSITNGRVPLYFCDEIEKEQGKSKCNSTAIDGEKRRQRQRNQSRSNSGAGQSADAMGEPIL